MTIESASNSPSEKVARAFPTLEALRHAHHALEPSPTDGGPLQAIVIRPTSETRNTVSTAFLSPDHGVLGDHWASGCWKSLTDGRPHPDVQVALMNSRIIQLIAGAPKRWPLAGDNLFVDFDLGQDRLPVGQQLQLGEVRMEITAEPHLGCGKFARRFGRDALQFVNSAEGKRLRLRGVYARILQEGRVAVGDLLQRI